MEQTQNKLEVCDAATKLMGQGNYNASDVVHKCIEHCTGTPNRGMTLRHKINWYGTKEFKFVISERFDSDYAKDPVTRHSVTGTRASVNGIATQ